MSRQFRAVLALAGGFAAAAMIASASLAAPVSDAPRPDPAQTLFVDLTAGANAAAGPAPNPGVAAAAGTPGLFVDLTKGDSPSVTPERAIPPSRPPPTRHVDLSGGAAPPPKFSTQMGNRNPTRSPSRPSSPTIPMKKPTGAVSEPMSVCIAISSIPSREHISPSFPCPCATGCTISSAISRRRRRSPTMCSRAMWIARATRFRASW